ncbi:MAG: hypothetical protein LBS83_03200 [Holosporales bacterium]|jgi:hypothetical protein|nr:hypothetical protein [Holosporales bacterium]
MKEFYKAAVLVSLLGMICIQGVSGDKLDPSVTSSGYIDVFSNLPRPTFFQRVHKRFRSFLRRPVQPEVTIIEKLQTYPTDVQAGIMYIFNCCTGFFEDNGEQEVRKAIEWAIKTYHAPSDLDPGLSNLGTGMNILKGLIHFCEYGPCMPQVEGDKSVPIPLPLCLNAEDDVSSTQEGVKHSPCGE